MSIVYFLCFVLTYVLTFCIGGAWLQAKESKFGIQAQFDCEHCNAYGCQYKWCHEQKLHKM